MSATKRGKQKQQEEVSEEEDFETFVRESLEQLRKGGNKSFSSFRINIRKFCPTVIECYYWNDIPLSIREQTTKKLFKIALFNYYLAQY